MKDAERSVWLSTSDGQPYVYVGHASRPITTCDPFEIQFDPGLAGQTVYVKTCDRRQLPRDVDARAHVVPSTGVLRLTAGG